MIISPHLVKIIKYSDPKNLTKNIVSDITLDIRYQLIRKLRSSNGTKFSLDIRNESISLINDDEIFISFLISFPELQGDSKLPHIPKDDLKVFGNCNLYKGSKGYYDFSLKDLSLDRVEDSINFGVTLGYKFVTGIKVIPTSDKLLKIILSKCTLVGLLSLVQVFSVSDSVFKDLYLEKFGTPLVDPNLISSWEIHYIQMFRTINLIQSRIPIYEDTDSTTDDYIDKYEISLNSYARSYADDRIESRIIKQDKTHILGKYNMKEILSTYFDTEVKKRNPLWNAVYLLNLVDTMVMLLLQTEFRFNERPILSNYTYAIYKYSKSYFESVVNKVPIYFKFESIKNRLDVDEIVSIFDYTDAEIYCIKLLNTPNIIMEEYGEKGLYIKYIINNYPHLVIM